MWAVRWAQARSGLRRAGAIAGVLGGSVDITLNRYEEIALSVQKVKAWAGVGSEWRSPDSGAVSVELGGRPLAFGIITGPADEPGSVVDYRAKGALQVFDDRLVTNRHFGPDELEALKASVWQRRDLSPGALMQDVITTAMGKPGGDLPIVFDSPREEDPGRVLELPGWDVGNLSAGEVLRRLAEGGPDMMLRPRMDGQAIVLGFVHGTIAQSAIAQDHGAITFDETADKSPLVGLRVLTSGLDTYDRVIVSGAGQGAGVALGAADDRGALAGPWEVYRERVVSESNSADPEQLVGRARVEVGSRPLVQVQASIRVDDPRAPWWLWQVGDLVRVRVAGRDYLPAGTYPMRVIAARFKLGSLVADVTLEPEGDRA